MDFKTFEKEIDKYLIEIKLNLSKKTKRKLI